jgi:hypothetical protein
MGDLLSVDALPYMTRDVTQNACHEWKMCRAFHNAAHLQSLQEFLVVIGCCDCDGVWRYCITTYLWGLLNGPRCVTYSNAIAPICTPPHLHSLYM